MHHVLYIDSPVAAEGVSVHPDAQDNGDIGSHCYMAVPTVSHSRGDVHVRRAASAMCF